jgi:homoprotocatechuate degradation regulator HpaR
MARFRPLLNEHGVTEQQWRIIRALADEGPMEQNQLSDYCKLSGPSLSGVAGRMEEQDLLIRKRIESDQRRMLISLTPRSRSLVKKMVPLVDARYQALEKEIGIDFIHEMYDALDALLARLDALDKGPQNNGPLKKK